MSWRTHGRLFLHVPSCIFHHLSSASVHYGQIRKKGKVLYSGAPDLTPLRKIVERLKAFRGSKIEGELKFCLQIYLRGFEGRLAEITWLLENDRGLTGLLRLLLWPEVPEHVLDI